MPASQSDIDALLAALASGTQAVRFADGRQVTYRSVTEIREALAALRAEQSGAMERSTWAQFARD